MMPDSVALLCESIIAHQMPNHQGATPSRSIALNVQDQAPSTEEIIHWSPESAYTFKNDAPKGEMTQARRLKLCRWRLHQPWNHFPRAFPLGTWCATLGPWAHSRVVQSSNRCMMLSWGSKSCGFVCSESSYNGSRCVLRSPCNSCAGCVFRERTVEQAEILLNNIFVLSTTSSSSSASCADTWCTHPQVGATILSLSFFDGGSRPQTLTYNDSRPRHLCPISISFQSFQEE
ncbi:hypothetical protein ZWY2020_040246 [Hordeum vulgare]|nr:hypothetical protein ZWY2020_040246 [Hordeum vulgare]